MPATARPSVHLRVLVPDDASWVVTTDRRAATALAPPVGFVEDALRADLEAGEWASDSRFGWAIIVDGTTAGFALVEGLDQRDAEILVRVGPKARGRGVGREVLRQLADHHFSANPEMVRLTGRTHENNVPMQRVFNAAGFRMEARYRDAVEGEEGGTASEWGYALTRGDWEAGRHRRGGVGYDLHGLSFALDETIEGEHAQGLAVRFLQEGRRVIGRYEADRLLDGESGGILAGDLLRYRFIHTAETGDEAEEVLGRGRARLQRREDSRLEIIDKWSDERGAHGERVLVQRIEAS